MKEIRMVDLYGQYEHIRHEIDHAIQEVIDSSAFIHGPVVDTFQRSLESWLGVRHVIPCANGTDALQLAMIALDLKPGDEVITPDFTFIATVEVVALLRLKPVIVDVDPATFNICPEAVRKATTPKTRAIVPVHLFGQCADMDPLLELAKKHPLHIIEDAAQALGAEYISRPGTRLLAGTMGDVGCTSFFPSKNLGCYGDGGACYTNSDDLAAKIRSIANHGQAAKYQYHTIGINSRLDSLQAAILEVKLQQLHEYNRKRQQVAEVYDEAFRNHPQIEIPARSPHSTHIFHQYTLKVRKANRDRLKEYLEKKGIPSMVYYPSPLHSQKAYSYLGYKEDDFPVTRELCERVISLPLHTELDSEQQEYIVKTILDFFN
jgi:UDP-2-acetamido-2-deoxy-ribo-hexuluronate aminotransferase